MPSMLLNTNSSGSEPCQHKSCALFRVKVFVVAESMSVQEIYNGLN